MPDMTGGAGSGNFSREKTIPTIAPVPKDKSTSPIISFFIMLID